jgi:hypothetical protein
VAGLAVDDRWTLPTPLSTARALLEKRQFARALTPLLEAWSETRSTRLAAFIERAITNDPKVYCLREPGGPWSIDVPVVDWSAALAGNLHAGLTGVDATITIARNDDRYLSHVQKALAPLGSRVEYR